jgi:hypothetical protein
MRSLEASTARNELKGFLERNILQAELTQEILSEDLGSIFEFFMLDRKRIQ